MDSKPTNSEKILPASSVQFRVRLFRGLIERCFEFVPGNRDFVRYHYGWRGYLGWWCEERLYRFLSRFGLVRCHNNSAASRDCLEFILKNLAEFEYLYALLGDQNSRDRIIEVLLLRILGERHVQLAAAQGEYPAQRTQLQRYLIREKTFPLGYHTHPINLYQIQGQEGPIRLNVNAFTLRNTFLLEQYVWRSQGAQILASEGDVVIDGGGCWGDTALFFADRVGKTGKVHSFEFDPENIKIFRLNLELNPDLHSRVEIVPFALWSLSKLKLNCSAGHGGSSALSSVEETSGSVETQSIDDYVRQVGTKVNFIKMDIEGAELHALKGAETTLRTFRPKLAICLYHSMGDFIQIPRYLEELRLDYEFHIGHVTMYHEETVLFAQPRLQE